MLEDIVNLEEEANKNKTNLKKLSEKNCLQVNREKIMYKIFKRKKKLIKTMPKKVEEIEYLKMWLD